MGFVIPRLPPSVNFAGLLALEAKRLFRENAVGYLVNFCILGDLELGLATTPEKWAEKGAHEFSEHKTIAGRPKLQSMGNTLDELHLEFVLHAITTDIGTVYQKLWDSKESGEVLSLVMGDGEYFGEYVITELTYERRAAWANGTTMVAGIGCALKQYEKSAAITITKRDRPAVRAAGTQPKTKTTTYSQTGSNDITPSTP